MDPNQPQPNTGSFMAPAGGGGSAIEEAMARRGMGGGGLNQVGQGAPTAPGAAQLPQVPAGAPAGVPAPQGQPAPQGAAPQVPGMPMGNPETQIILGALRQRLASISKVDEHNAGVGKTGVAPTGY